MDLDVKLDNFISDTKSHAFLIFGPWGVGKTFAMDLWLKTKQAEEYAREFKVIKLSLFGISNVNELNALALKNECFKNKFIRWFKNLKLGVGFKAPLFTIDFPLQGIVQSLLSEKHQGKQKYLFILDDIERKDNALSIEKILGFVDSLPIENTKVILIANLEKLNGLDEFKGFKEKVIQDEFSFERPTRDAITSIIGKKYATYFINHNHFTNNLRTLIKLKMILSCLENDNEVNHCLIDCIYYCLLSICENKFDREELRTNYITIQKSDVLRILSGIRNDGNDSNDIEKNASKFVDKFSSNVDFLYENIKQLGLLDEIKENDLKKFIQTIYRIIHEERYEELKGVQIPLRDVPLKKCDEKGDSIFYSKNPNKEYLRVMEKFEKFFESKEYNLLDIFRNFIYVIVYYDRDVFKNLDGRKKEREIIKKCPKLISLYIFNNYNFDNENINLKWYADVKPKWLIDIEKRIFKKCSERFYTYFKLKARKDKIDLIELDSRIDSLKSIFAGEIFDCSLLKLDEIMTNAIKYIDALARGEMLKDTWSYCHSLIEWISRNNSDDKFVKTKKLLNELASKKTLSGYRLSILVTQYGLMQEIHE